MIPVQKLDIMSSFMIIFMLNGCLFGIYEHVDILWMLHYSSQLELKPKNQINIKKFNGNIKCKLNIEWIEYVDMWNIGDSVRKFQAPWHNIP